MVCSALETNSLIFIQIISNHCRKQCCALSKFAFVILFLATVFSLTTITVSNMKDSIFTVEEEGVQNFNVFSQVSFLYLNCGSLGSRLIPQLSSCLMLFQHQKLFLSGVLVVYPNCYECKIQWKNLWYISFDASVLLF